MEVFFKGSKTAFTTSFDYNDKRSECKVDTGAFYSAIPIEIVCMFFNASKDTILKMMENYKEVKVYGVGSELHGKLCWIKNVDIGGIHFDRFNFITVYTDNDIKKENKDTKIIEDKSKVYRKGTILLGYDFITAFNMIRFTNCNNKGIMLGGKFDNVLYNMMYVQVCDDFNVSGIDLSYLMNDINICGDVGSDSSTTSKCVNTVDYI